MTIAEWKKFIESKNYFQISKNAAIFIFIFIFINLPFIIFGYLKNGSISNWSNTYLFHVNRPLYWDTPLGALTLWFGKIPLESEASAISLGFMILLFFLKPRLDIFAKTIIITAAALVYNRVYSTQFHLWFIPLCLIYLSLYPKRKYLIFLILALELLNVFIYPLSFTYTLMEIGGFSEKIATISGGLWTRLFCIAILFRSYFLYELIIYLLDLKNTLLIHLTKVSRILGVAAIAYYIYLII